MEALVGLALTAITVIVLYFAVTYAGTALMNRESGVMSILHGKDLKSVAIRVIGAIVIAMVVVSGARNYLIGGQTEPGTRLWDLFISLFP